MKSENRKSICLITAGLVKRNLRLQPWRYLHEVALQLTAQGHKVTVISDGGSPALAEEWINGVPVKAIPCVSSPWWRTNLPLQQSIEQLKPNIILWHLGLTSFLHQQLDGWGQIPTVGIFTSPIYSLQDLSQVGLRKITADYQMSASHVLGTLVSRPVVKQFTHRNHKLHSLVVQTQTTRQQLLRLGVRSWPIEVIEPGVDETWDKAALRLHNDMRINLGYRASDKVVVYFGSPARLRGLHTLLRAFELARQSDASLKLLVLSRHHGDELLSEDTELRCLLSRNEVSQHVQVISGYLDREWLVRLVATGDVVALPFELVPSDAPLSLLEAHALGRPVVTTNIACLPELASRGISYLAQPADPSSLAKALRQAAAELPNCGEHASGIAGSSSARRFVRSWQKMGEEWSQLVQRL